MLIVIDIMASVLHNNNRSCDTMLVFALQDGPEALNIIFNSPSQLQGKLKAN